MRFANLIDTVNEWAGRVVAPLLLVMVLIGVYEVAARNIFNKPTIWVWELNGYCLCVVIVLGGAYTLLHRGHVSVDIVYARLPVRTKAILDQALFLFFILPLMGVLFWQSIDLALISIALRETSRTPWGPIIYPFKTILSLAFLLMLLQGLSHFIRNLPIVFRGKGAS